MAGRLPKLARRQLPVRRALAVALVAAALGAGSANATGEWVVNGASPTPEQGASTWQVSPAGGTWVTTPAAAPEPATAADILDVFVTQSTGATGSTAIPPSPPTAVDVAAPTAELDENNPTLLALVAAQKDLDAISGELADVRSRLETATEAEAVDLNAEATELEQRRGLAAAKVDELQVAVDKLKEEAAKRAAEAAANPFVSSDGLTFAPVSGTVPTINPGLANQLDSYLAGKGSPLAGLGATFVYQATAVGLDPRLVVAISGAETSFGTYGPSQTIHNPFGMGPGIVYPSWEDSIAGASRNLGGSLYKGSGLVTIAQIQKRWAPNGAANDPTNLNSHWFKNVSRYYAELGGDPNGSVFTDRAAAATAIPVAPGVAPGIQGTVAAPAAYGVATAVPGGGQNTGPAAVKLAQTFIGTPYVWGGTTPKGFDCSGLVQYVYAKQGVRLPRVAEQQARVGTPIAPEQLAPGDAVFFADRTGYIHHEGMYIGGGYFIHAPHTGDVVKISSLLEPYYATQYAGARRY